MEDKIKVVIYIVDLNSEEAHPLIKHFESCCEKALRNFLQDVEVVSKDSKNADTCLHICPIFIGYAGDETAPNWEESLEMMRTYELPLSYSVMFDATGDTDTALLKSRQESGINHIDVLDDINYFKDLIEEFNSIFIEPIRQKRKQECIT